MDTIEFNPFEDRLSRDIRNDLSEALVACIESGNMEILNETSKRYRTQALDLCYAIYLEKRLSNYELALNRITPTIIDPIDRAVILWNLHLFFEVHEILEHVWYDATGDYKKLLQALIRAAGVYIKLEFGYSQAASNIANKAIPVLQDTRQLLEPHVDPNVLISALSDLDQKPPQLVGR